MNPDLVRVVALVVSIGLLILIAKAVAWTAAAVVAWLVSVPLFIASALIPLPLPVRIATTALALAWCLILLFPERSPIGPLSRAEWATQRVIRHVSAAAREAYLAGTLGGIRSDLIAQLDDCEPPNDAWRTAKAAQMLDLRADPPQVGAGDATKRLVSWPWRVALDHRVLPIRIRIQDAMRARKLPHVERPGFDDMTSSMQYDYYFLKNAWHRFEDLRALEGGLGRRQDEARALIDLIAAVSPPEDGWATLRDLTVELQGLELKAATDGVSPAERARMLVAGQELRDGWLALSRRDARGLPWPDEGRTGGPENQSTRVG